MTICVHTRTHFYILFITNHGVCKVCFLDFQIHKLDKVNFRMFTLHYYPVYKD